jgi:hypothetical protein
MPALIGLATRPSLATTAVGQPSRCGFLRPRLSQTEAVIAAPRHSNIRGGSPPQKIDGEARRQ